MTYGVPSVLSVSPWRMVFRLFCQCHHASVASFIRHCEERSDVAIFHFRAKQKPHKNAEPTQKHKTLMRLSSPGRSQHFSIFSSGCKRSNLSTFSGRKGSQFFWFANFWWKICLKISRLPLVARNDSERVARNDSERVARNDSERIARNDSERIARNDNIKV